MRPRYRSAGPPRRSGPSVAREGRATEEGVTAFAILFSGASMTRGQYDEVIRRLAELGVDPGEPAVHPVAGIITG